MRVRTWIVVKVLIVLACTSAVYAQQTLTTPGERLGLALGLGLNMHSADFKQLPNVDNCCPKFESGSGSGFSMGLSFEHYFSSKWSTELRLNYQQQDATLVASETFSAFNTSTQTTGNAEIEHRIATQLSTIGAEAMLRFQPARVWYLSAGIRVAQLSSISFQQVEQLKSSDWIFVDTQHSTRNEHSGDIAAINHLQTMLQLGTEFDIPLNKSRSLMLSPEVQYQLSLSQLVQNVSWSASALRFGVAFRYRLSDDEQTVIPKAQPTPPPLEKKPAVVMLDTVPKQRAVVSKEQIDNKTIVRLVSQRATTESLVDTLTTEEFASRQLKPLLNYIFFDAEASRIPDRYLQYTASTIAKHEIPTSATVMQVYYDILNIVGQRMKTNAKATLTLSGCISQDEWDNRQNKLARERAESVRDYLTQVWSINSSRIRIESRNLPAAASKASDELETNLSDEENRRVELTASFTDILAPLVVSDTLHLVSPENLRFLIRPKHDTLNSVSVRFPDAHQQEVRGPWTALDTVRIQWSPRDLNTSATTLNASMTLRYQHSADTTLTLLIPQKYVGLRTKHEMNLHDRTIDRFQLILFEFNKSNLTSDQRSILDEIQRSCTPQSVLQVEGLTDMMGDTEHNERLAAERARMVASALNRPNTKVVSLGESNLYPNTLPEGRFYNRTVIVTVETPRN